MSGQSAIEKKKFWIAIDIILVLVSFLLNSLLLLLLNAADWKL